MSNEIKVGDKVRVREDAPRVYLRGWGKAVEYNVYAVDGDAAVITYGYQEIAIPLKYLVKVEEDKKAPKFKEGDKAILKGFVCTIIGTVYSKGAFAGYIIESPKLYGDIAVPESDLEPYTEPTEEKTPEVTRKSPSGDFWDTYTADLAKEVAIVYAKQKRDVRLAVRAAKSVVEELKKK